MKRTVTLGEMIGFAIVVFGVLISFYVNTNVRLTALEIQTSNNMKIVDDIKQSLKELSVGQNEIKIILQNKQDRK